MFLYSLFEHCIKAKLKFIFLQFRYLSPFENFRENDRHIYLPLRMSEASLPGEQNECLTILSLTTMLTMMMIEVMMMMMMMMIIPFEAAGCGSSNNCTPASAAAPGRPSLHNTAHRHHPHNLQRPHNLQDTHTLHYPHFLKSPLNYYLSNPLREAIKYCLADFIGQGDPPPFADMLLHCTISFYSEIQNPSLTHNVHYGSDKIDERKRQM